jgi:hypothetical protein
MTIRQCFKAPDLVFWPQYRVGVAAKGGEASFLIEKQMPQFDDLEYSDAQDEHIRVYPSAPKPLPNWQWLDLFKHGSRNRLLGYLRIRAETHGILPPGGTVEPVQGIISRSASTSGMRRASKS